MSEKGMLAMLKLPMGSRAVLTACRRVVNVTCFAYYLQGPECL